MPTPLRDHLDWPFFDDAHRTLAEGLARLRAQPPDLLLTRHLVAAHEDAQPAKVPTAPPTPLGAPRPVVARRPRH